MMNDVPTLLDRHIIVGGHRIAGGVHGAGDPPRRAFVMEDAPETVAQRLAAFIHSL